MSSTFYRRLAEFLMVVYTWQIYTFLVVPKAIQLTASVPLTAENFWTTYALYENLICSI